MRRSVNNDVKDNFSRYKGIKSSLKKLTEGEIPLHKVATHPSNQEGNVALVAEGGDVSRFNVNLNVDKTRSFKFKIFCDSLTHEPCYRFDSDGNAHSNPASENLPLSQRVIPTPHFHEYNHRGELLAYKTPELVNREGELVSDYTQMLKHFCEEENVQSDGDVQVLLETLALGSDEFDDPLEGAEFT